VTNQLDFEVSFSGFPDAGRAHIHRGGPGVAGPIVVNLAPNDDDVTTPIPNPVAAAGQPPSGLI